MDESLESEIAGYLDQLEQAIRLRAGKRGLLWLEAESETNFEDFSFLEDWDFSSPSRSAKRSQGFDAKNGQDAFQGNFNSNCENPAAIPEPVPRESHPFLDLAPKILPKSAEPEVIPPEIQRLAVDERSATQKLNPYDAKSLDSLHIRIKNCQDCDLCHERRVVVFGVGNQQARLMMIGDFPTKEADLSGKPFSDQGGKLLTQIISALGVHRDSVYLCNVVKCHPPGERKPHKKEILSCEGYLKKQIELVGPDLIITMGNTATEALLREGIGQGQPHGSTQGIKITKMRGKPSQFRGMTLLPTFHPSYLLHKPEALSLVWEDIRLARKLLFSKKREQ